MTDPKIVAFERANTARHRAWLKATGMHECTLYRLTKDGSYQNPSTYAAWQGFQDGWQAALAQKSEPVANQWPSKELLLVNEIRSLLEESAGPFDKACTLLRSLCEDKGGILPAPEVNLYGN